MKGMRIGIVVAGLLLAWTVPVRGVNWDEVIFRAVDISAEEDPEQIVSLVIHEYRVVGAHQFARPAGVEEVGLLIVGGGGSGARGNSHGGGGGAGGLVYAEGYGLLPAGTLEVIVGDGGTAGGSHPWTASYQGGNSSLDDLVALGGGAGGKSGSGSWANGQDGGSGGGNRYSTGGNDYDLQAGTGLQPTETPNIGYGNDGHSPESGISGGGGGGAGLPATGNAGGIGKQVWGDWYAGGGGSSANGAGGLGGGGAGNNSGFGEAGADNTGGGAGATHGTTYMGGDGGSGIVIVRYALDDVTGWDGGAGFYDLHGSARRVLVEDAVKVRVPDAESLTITEDGELLVQSGASLTVDGTLTLEAGAVLGGGGIVYGDLTLQDGAAFAFSTTQTLTVNDGTWTWAISASAASPA